MFVTNRTPVLCERRVEFSGGVIVAKRNEKSRMTLTTRRALTWSVLVPVGVVYSYTYNSCDVLVLLKERSP